jgi:hypothetical protein
VRDVFSCLIGKNVNIFFMVFYDAVSQAMYYEMVGLVKNELERGWKEIVAYLYYPSICLEGLRITMNNLS